jgi:hypothetical protein
MYFPVLRGKMYEMLALRDLAGQLGADDSIMPVVEPLGAHGSYELTVKELVDNSTSFCLITNPRFGALRGRTVGETYADLVDGTLDEYDLFVPTLYIDRDSTSQEITEFAAQYEDRRAVFVTQGASKEHVEEAAALNPEFALIREGQVPVALRNLFPREIRVQITDPFNRQARNQDYPDDEFFSDRHLVIPDDAFEHFGDYSIVGESTESGFAPYCIALHHCYINSGENDAIYIRHYKSDTNETQDDQAGKFAEAVAKLVSDIRPLGPRNRTLATAEYQRYHQEGHYPGLGVPKRLGISQHLEIMMRLI